VIVPGPERGVLHLELHGPAQALAGDNRAAGEFPGLHRMRASYERAKMGEVHTVIVTPAFVDLTHLRVFERGELAHDAIECRARRHDVFFAAYYFRSRRPTA
jgi:hypothetical protein